MNKIVAIIMVIMLMTGLAACAGKKKDVSPDTVELTPSLSQEDLKDIVDFDAAAERGEIITAEDGEIIVSMEPAESGAATNSTSFRSTTLPDAVWDDSPISYGNDEFTLPDAVLMADGSLGTLKIPKIGLTVSVYETDDEIEGMAYGVAHLKESSCYAGHVVLTGHNRGVNTYFGQIHTLVEGDKVELTTALGTKVYAVSSSQLIDENDWSLLGRTVDNRISLITCIDNSPTQRLCVQAVEIA